MYLHQQLVDILLLPTTRRLAKIQSKYTYCIKNYSDDTIIKEWYKFKSKPNTISKLRYQVEFRYNYTQFSKFMKVTKWNYIKGMMYCDNQIMVNSIGRSRMSSIKFELALKYGIIPSVTHITRSILVENLEIFKLCLKNDVTLTNEIMKYTVINNHIEMFKICLEHNVIPTQEHMNSSVRHINYKEIFEICLSVGVKPNQETMNNAIRHLRNDIYVFDKCIEYGVVTTLDTMNVAVECGRLDIFELCLKSGIQPTLETMVISVNDDGFNDKNIKMIYAVFKECIKLGIKP